MTPATAAYESVDDWRNEGHRWEIHELPLAPAAILFLERFKARYERVRDIPRMLGIVRVGRPRIINGAKTDRTDITDAYAYNYVQRMTDDIVRSKACTFEQALPID